MLKIRFQRIGRKNRPVYRLVVTEHTDSVAAACIDQIGRYDVLAKPKIFEVDEKKLESWMKKGAKPSSTVARILKGKGAKNMDSYIESMHDRKKKKQAENTTPQAVAPAAAPVA